MGGEGGIMKYTVFKSRKMAGMVGTPYPPLLLPCYLYSSLHQIFCDMWAVVIARLDCVI